MTRIGSAKPLSTRRSRLAFLAGSHATSLPHDKRRYRKRNRIEIMFGRLKDWRRLATRYDQSPKVFRVNFADLSITPDNFNQTNRTRITKAKMRHDWIKGDESPTRINWAHLTLARFSYALTVCAGHQPHIYALMGAVCVTQINPKRRPYGRLIAENHCRAHNCGSNDIDISTTIKIEFGRTVDGLEVC